MARRIVSSRTSVHRRNSFETVDEIESLTSNVQFMMLLRQLPDILERQEKDIKSLMAQLKAKSRYVSMQNHYEKRIKELQDSLNESLEIATRKDGEVRQLQQRLELVVGDKVKNDEESLLAVKRNYEQQMRKVKQALDEKRKEVDRLRERHASISERKVSSDQRRTENTLSTNRQSELESEYIADFKDGWRIDAIETIRTRVSRHRREALTKQEHLSCYRLACFIFETAYDCASTVRDSFVTLTSSLLEHLAAEAPAIALDHNYFENKLSYVYHYPSKGSLLTTQDALNDVMILVKEKAKRHDLSYLFKNVQSAVEQRWKRSNQTGNSLPPLNHTLISDLAHYIQHCSEFAWCLVTQVPPLKIDYKSSTYNSKSHMVSQAFTSADDQRSPSRSRVHAQLHTLNVACYLWPTLQDIEGRVIRKGEVVLNANK